MPAQTKKNKPAVLTVDFSNVEDRRAGKKGIHVAEGDYLMVAKDYEIKTKKDDSSRRYINWEMYIHEGKHKGKGPVYHVSSLVPENLWSLRNLLEDMGVKVPKKALDLPLAKILNRPFGATLEDDEYTNEDGKTTTKSRIAATFPASEFAETAAGDEDEEEPDEEEATEAVTSDDDDEDIEELDIDDI